jgi:formate/nitrite transporter
MTRKPSPDEVAAPQVVTFDAIMPASMAVRAEQSGVKRAATDPIIVLVLSVLAGAFVSFGAIFATTVTAGTGLPYGVGRLLTGLVFCSGLIMVIIAGAELFTGNNLIVMAWASGKVKARAVLTNWVLSFAGNFVGAILTAALMFYTTQYTFGDGAVGLVALNTANSKASLAFVPALTLGIMCNALVCLAVWMCFSARTNIDRVVTAIPPIAAFAAAGFEHCIANIYFIPMGLFIKAGAPQSFWTAIGKTASDYPGLTWSNFFLGNLVPVTIGNIIGGSIMIAAVYWFVYLRKSDAKIISG